MDTKQQQSMEGAARGMRPATGRTTLKTILVHVQDDGSLDRRIEAGLALARAASAHLSCVQVTPIQAYMEFGNFGVAPHMEEVVSAIDRQAARLRSRTEEKLRTETVSWDYEQCIGDVAAGIVSRAALADLVVVGRESGGEGVPRPAIGLLGDLLYRSRSPLFIPGDGAAPVDVSGVALVAWDGSYEAANAVRSSVGLLSLAGAVRIIRVAEAKDEGFPAKRALDYLARQGIEAEFVTEQPSSASGDEDVVAAALLAHARASKAAYLLMGGYSHSRVAEYIFGGVTRTLLKTSPVSLVLAH